MILWPAQMGENVVLELQNIFQTHCDIHLMLSTVYARWW